jgi:hypothetical protein
MLSFEGPDLAHFPLFYHRLLLLQAPSVSQPDFSLLLRICTQGNTETREKLEGSLRIPFLFHEVRTRTRITMWDHTGEDEHEDQRALWVPSSFDLQGARVLLTPGQRECLFL